MTPEQTRDFELGISWWNYLPEYSRVAWLKEAGSESPTDAWAAYKKTLRTPRDVAVELMAAKAIEAASPKRRS